MNISIALIGFDKEYRERLLFEMQKYKDFSLSVFEDEGKYRTRKSNKRIDVAIVDPDLSDEPVEIFDAKLTVCLCEAGSENAARYEKNIPKIEKYQRISNINKAVLNAFSEKVGDTVSFDKIRDTKLISVFSPSGGSGKTTVAYSMAMSFARAGKATFFLNFEESDSSLAFLQRKEENIVSLLEIIEKDVNFEMKLKGILTTGNDSVNYVNGFTKASDYSSVTDSDVSKLLMKIRNSGLFECIIVDITSSMSGINKTIMELSDRIVLVEKPGEIPYQKMENLLRDENDNNKKSIFFEDNMDKMVKVCNFTQIQARYHDIDGIKVIGRVRNYGDLRTQEMLRNIADSNCIDIAAV